MYYIDSLTRQVTAYDYDAASGAISNPRPLVTLPEGTGVPDGMTVSVDGTLWVRTGAAPASPAGTRPPARCCRRSPCRPTSPPRARSPDPRWTNSTSPPRRYQEPITALAAQPFAGGLFRYRTDTKGRPAAVFPG